MTDGPPLFAGEPEHCSLCGEPGHTHDDHWLFQHEPVKALQSRLATATKLVRELSHVCVIPYTDAGNDLSRRAQAFLANQPAAPTEDDAYNRTITKETMAVLDATKPIPDADLDEILESAGLAFWLAPFARAVQAMRKGQP